MRSETYPRLVQAQPVPQPASRHAAQHARRLLRRLDPALAFLVVAAGSWTSWGVAQWLLTRWAFH